MHLHCTHSILRIISFYKRTSCTIKCCIKTTCTVRHEDVEILKKNIRVSIFLCLSYCCLLYACDMLFYISHSSFIDWWAIKFVINFFKWKNFDFDSFSHRIQLKWNYQQVSIYVLNKVYRLVFHRFDFSFLNSTRLLTITNNVSVRNISWSTF